MTKEKNVILTARDIVVEFDVRDKVLTAIRGVSLELVEGEVLALVGESGSGKSVLTKTFTGMLEENGRIAQGSIDYRGQDLTALSSHKDWEQIRGAKIATIFQDPMTSLDPIKTIGSQITEVIVKHQGKTGTLACSLVSSPALANIAQKYGFANEETLTGFKYIAKAPNLLYGFEEALGYLVAPQKVRDKDGISAAIVFLDLVRSLKAQGKTLLDHARDFAQTFGAYTSGQISIRVSDLADIGKLMSALRHNPPSQIGGHAVEQSIDHLQTERQNDILVYHLTNGSRLIVRPSGTEPKVKFYLDAKGSSEAEAASKKEEAIEQKTDKQA